MSNAILTSDKKNSLLIKVGLFVVGLFVAILLSLSFSAMSAHAAGSDPGGGIGVGGGTGNPPGNGGTPGGGSTTRPPKPGDTPHYTFDPNNYNYQVGCSSWSGSGSFKPSASCTMTDAAIKSGSGRAPYDGFGTIVVNDILTSNGTTVGEQVPGSTYIKKDACAPSGNKSAYAQTYNKIVESTYVYTTTYRWSDSANTWVGVNTATTLMGQYVGYSFLGCVYPTDSYSYTTCFYNYGGTSAYSNDRTRAASAWSNFGARPALASDPRPPTGGSGTTAPSCDKVGSAYVQFNKYPNLLGYYEMHISYSYKQFKDLRWVTNTGAVLYNQWSAGSVLSGGATTWWAYSCRAQASNLTEGAYNSQGALPNRDDGLNAANCPQSLWQCIPLNKSTVGLDTTAIANGTVSATKPVTVMRNGQKVPVHFSQIKVVDQTGGGSIDVTNGQTGKGVRNVSNIEYQTTIVNGSTPYYGTDPNDAKQYFQQYANSTAGSLTTEKFGVWISNTNANLNKGISFVWSSDNGKPFVMERQYRVTGEFLIPRGGAIGSGSSAGAPPGGGTFLKGTYSCVTYSGTGVNRKTTGTLYTPTNQVNVSRSVNNPN